MTATMFLAAELSFRRNDFISKADRFMVRFFILDILLFICAQHCFLTAGFAVICGKVRSRGRNAAHICVPTGAFCFYGDFT